MLDKSSNLGPYKIISFIGKGGMGEVYRARDARLDRDVAIKVIAERLINDPATLIRFEKEAKAVAALSHPNILSIFEFDRQDGVFFVVTELLEGQTLRQLLKKGRITWRKAAKIGVSIAEGMAAAHSKGIIHRDLKPENIFLTSHGQIKILDFGLAVVKQQQREASFSSASTEFKEDEKSVVGTVGYMSPEQIKGEAVDSRTDLFSFGCILYEMVTHRRPFQGESSYEIQAAVLRDEPQNISDLGITIPITFEKLILHCLEKNVDQRSHSAHDVAFELQGTLESSNSESVKPTVPRLSKSILLKIAAIILVLTGLWSFTKRNHVPTTDALNWYELATKDLRSGAYYSASRAFQRAIEIDDFFPMAHAGLAEAWMELDYPDNASYEWARVTESVPDRSSLPPLQQAYLQAINLTLIRDFEKAIEVYKKIVQSSPQKAKPYAYLDLGRAYEKNEDHEFALNAYSNATKLAPEEPAAFLRLGILLSKNETIDAALTAFNETQILYTASSNHEGIAEVLYQRGLMFSSRGRLKEAEAELNSSIRKAQAIDSKQQEIKGLLELSRVACYQADFTRAKEYAKKALDLARENRMENLSTSGLISLGSAYRDAGQFEDALKYFLTALQFAQLHRGLKGEATAKLFLAKLQIQLHNNPDEGLRYVESALSFFRHGGYRREFSNLLILRGDAYDLKGDYTAALQSYEQRLQLAQQANDPSQIAMSKQRIGFVYASQEQYEKALQHFEASLRLYDSLGNRLYALHSETGRADMLWHMGYYSEAQSALSRASSVSQHLENQSSQILARVQLIDAQMTLSKRLFSQAIKKSQKAIASNKDMIHDIEALYTLGLAKLFAGNKTDGLAACREALEQALHVGDPRIISQARLALAEALLETGQAHDALDIAVQTRQSSAKAGQKESEWRSLLIAARASYSLRDLANVRQFSSLAKKLHSTLSAELGREFLSRPDIQKFARYQQELLDK